VGHGGSIRGEKKKCEKKLIISITFFLKTRGRIFTGWTLPEDRNRTSGGLTRIIKICRSERTYPLGGESSVGG